MRYLAILAASAVLGACSVTPHEMGPDNSVSSTRHVPQPPEAVYRQVVEGARSCFRHSLWRIDSDYFADVGRGRVAVVVAPTSTSQQAMLLMTWAPEAGGSSVTTLMRSAWADKLEAAVQGWLSGDVTACPKNIMFNS